MSKGVILAEEVGLGKTIEAALIICQYLFSRKSVAAVGDDAITRSLRADRSAY